MVSDVAVALSRNALSVKTNGLQKKQIIDTLCVATETCQIIETAIKNISKSHQQVISVPGEKVLKEKQKNKSNEQLKLDDLLDCFEPIEWEMSDFPNLVLETLEMDGKDLREVPAVIAEIEYYAFREVQAVSFNSNDKLTEATVLGKLDNLQAINMCGTGIDSVPVSWSKLKKLSFLGLGHNPALRNLSPISSMTTLQWLDLGGCGLKTIPNEIHQLTQLVVLAIGYNPGIVVDESLSKFTKLRRLALNDCELEQVPSAVYTLSQLRHLHLDNNFLVSFTQDVLRLKNLVQLTVTGNPSINFPKLLNQLEDMKQIVVDDDFNIAGTAFAIRQKVKRSSEAVDL